MSMLRERLPLVLALAVLGVLGWQAVEWQAARAREAAEEEARIAAEIEAEQQAQLEAARRAREAKESAPITPAPDREERAAALAHLREVDRVLLLDVQGRDLEVRKRLDLTPEADYRVAAWQERGRRAATSAKVDLDRDDRWDERWFFGEDGGVRREIAPDDDERFTVFEVLDGDRFVAEGAQRAP